MSLRPRRNPLAFCTPGFARSSDATRVLRAGASWCIWTRITVIQTLAFLVATTLASHFRCVMSPGRLSSCPLQLVLLCRWLTLFALYVQQASPPFKLNPSTNPDRPGQRTNYIMLVDRGPRKSPISRFLWMYPSLLLCNLLMSNRCCS